MEFTGVYHKTSEQMSYALNDKELVVNLKTGYDVKSSTGIPMTREYSEEMRNGTAHGRRSFTRNGSPIRSGGQRPLCRRISGANIILNCARTAKYGIILKMDS